MSIALYVAAALVFAIGTAMVGFGIPINEFSFGNTLIIAGTIAMVGGVVVFAIGVVVRRLQILAEAYVVSAAPVARQPETEGAVSAARSTAPVAAARTALPEKPKASVRESFESFEDEREGMSPPPFLVPPSSAAPATAGLGARRPSPAATPPSFVPQPPRPEEEVFGTPNLPNPDEAPAFELDRLSAGDEPSRGARDRGFSLPPLFGAKQDQHGAFDAPAPLSAKPPASPTPALPDAARRSFDAMWPDQPGSPPTGTVSPDVTPAFHVSLPEPAHDVAPLPESPRAVPILKSGVVDGMGYTLYVDGSIEAELPQGTLRFASINELRAHLEQAS